jgi:hypothetical protein
MNKMATAGVPSGTILAVHYTKNIAQQSLITLFQVMRKVSSYSIQLMPALKMNIIIVHPWDVVFPRIKCNILTNKF